MSNFLGRAVTDAGDLGELVAGRDRRFGRFLHNRSAGSALLFLCLRRDERLELQGRRTDLSQNSVKSGKNCHIKTEETVRIAGEKHFDFYGK